MKRNRRLLAAMLLFLASVVAGVVQAWIVQAYITSAVMGGWEQFAEFFGVTAPDSGPVKFCFDYCAPKLPFTPGWIAIFSFMGGLIITAHAWWKPRT